MGNFAFDYAFCVDEACKKLTTGKYDVVISDYELPKKNGLQLLKELRDQKSNISFILFTGKGREEVAIQALNMGADRYFNKQGAPETVYGELAHALKQLVNQKRLSEKLSTEEERFRQIFSNTPMGVVIYEVINEGEDFVIRDINSAAENIEKIKKATVLGKSVSNVFPGVNNFGIFEVFKRVFKTGKAEYFPDAIYRDNRDKGSWRENWVIKLSNDNIAAIYNNITERKKAEEALVQSELQYRLLADNMCDVIWTMDLDWHFTYVSPSIYQLRGYSPEEVMKQSIIEALTPGSARKVLDCVQAYTETGRIPSSYFELEQPCKDGSTVLTEVNFTVLRDKDGKPRSILGVSRDISHRKRAEERQKILERKVNEYSKHLKWLVDLRTAQLKDANERLVKSERLAAIGELAGMVGHDLRNPLAAIKNTVYYLKKKGKAISETQAKEMFEIIEKSIDHSDKIIDDLLDYSREMHLELTKYLAHNLVDEAIGVIKVPDRIKIINNVHQGIWIWVNADKMLRVFINLLKNAIDAISDRGLVEINSCQLKDCVEITFADTGVGIPDEVLSKLFLPLFTTKAQGMGFGLAICKRIVEAHGGTIIVETKLNNGTKFTIRLPLQPKMNKER